MANELIKLWPAENKFLNILSEIGKRGITFDSAKAIEYEALAEQNMIEIKDRLGFDPGKRIDLEQALLVDLDLPVVLKSEKTGNPSFNKVAMAEYDMMLSAINNPLAKDILAYRGWQQANSFYYSGYQKLVSPDGRIRPNYKPAGTRTSRLSCEKPNLQQIPRVSDKPWSKAIKSLFVPTNDEWVLWGFDYSSLEYRLALFYAQKLGPEMFALIERVNNGEDFHQATADLIYEITGIRLTRYDAKQMNFAILYGAGVDKLAYMLKSTRDESTGRAEMSEITKLMEGYHTAFPGFKKIARKVNYTAKSKGYIKYWTGRRRHFNSRWNKHKTKDAWNSLCQGGGAEIVKHAMIRLYEKIDNPQCKMVLQVHDEVDFEIRKDKLDYYRPLIVECMMDVDPRFNVKFHVEDKQWAA